MGQRTVMSGILGPATTFVIMADGPWGIVEMNRVIDHLNVTVAHFEEDEKSGVLASETQITDEQ